MSAQRRPSRASLRPAGVAPQGRRQCLQAAAAWAAAAALGGLAPGGSARAAAGDEPSALERIRRRGQLSVAVYLDMPPFFAQGRGIDADLAEALAAALDLKLSLLPFPAGENMDDDLRNMVWRGHYLGFGPADVMLHVPVERALMAGNPQVLVFAPYYRERIVLARDREKLPRVDSLADLKGQRVAVAGQSLAGWLLIGADEGALREQLSTRWSDGTAAAKAVLGGEFVACAGHASELESVLGGNARYIIEPLPTPRAPRDGWAVGMAVKKDASDLAAALRQALESMAGDGRLARIFSAHSLSWRKP